MTSIENRISVHDAQPLDMSKIKPIAVWEQQGEQFENYVKAAETVLESRHSTRPDTSKNPAYAAYATVQVGGQVVAEIDNHGWVTTSNTTGAMLGNLPAVAQGVISGPNLAKARAEYLADLLGGEVVMSSTALTQTAFANTPQPRIELDTKAMLADPLYQNLQRLKQARAQYLEGLAPNSTLGMIA
jgi:hypothetical protein